jgi:hypothetical protein
MIRGTPADASALAVARPMPAVPPHSSAEVDSRLRGMVGKMIEAPSLKVARGQHHYS